LKIPRRKTADRYGVSVRTIERWEANPELDFPKSTLLNGRRYDDIERLDDWDAKCAAAGRVREPDNKSVNNAGGSGSEIEPKLDKGRAP
jgi:hypothetical protein